MYKRSVVWTGSWRKFSLGSNFGVSCKQLPPTGCWKPISPAIEDQNSSPSFCHWRSKLVSRKDSWKYVKHFNVLLWPKIRVVDETLFGWSWSWIDNSQKPEGDKLSAIDGNGEKSFGLFALHFVTVLFLVGYWKQHCYGDCCFDNARHRFCLLVLDVGRFGVVFELCCIVFGRMQGMEWRGCSV